MAPDYLKQDFDRVTPYTYLTQAAPLTAGEHIVEAVIPTLRERELLQLEDHEPGLIHRRTVRQNRGDPARLLYPGSRYQLFGRFTSEVRSPAGAPCARISAVDHILITKSLPPLVTSR